MSRLENEFGQPIGAPVHDGTDRTLPPRTPLRRRLAWLDPHKFDIDGQQQESLHDLVDKARAG